MLNLRQKTFAFLSNPQNVRLVFFGLTLVGLIVSLGAPDPVAACIPLSDGGPGC